MDSEAIISSHTPLKFILSSGHRNTNRGGASGERDWTDDWALAQKASIEARGGIADIVHRFDGDGDDDESLRLGLQGVAHLAADIAASRGPYAAYISGHYNGTGSNNSSGFHAIYPDARSGVDTKAKNPLDVRLARAMAKRVGETKTVALLNWTDDAKAGFPGVMSERETRVGSTLYGGVYGRLGEFVGTLGFRETTARVIIEAGNISNPKEAAYIRDWQWVRNVYCEAITDALEDVFGPLPGKSTPDPIPQPPTEKPVITGPIIPYPAGLNKARATLLFSFVIGEDDWKYAFDESGPVSNLWLSYVTEHGRYPRLEDVKFEDKHKLFIFSDGSVIVAAPGQPVAYL